MKEYNKKVCSINIVSSSVDDKQKDEGYLSQLDINGNGIIRIKTLWIDNWNPIYHVTSSRTLQKSS